MTSEAIHSSFQNVLIACLIFLALLTMAAIVRSIIGPRTTDRIIAINMIGTLTMTMFSILTIYLEEDYLADVTLIYAMVSFLAVVVLTKIFSGIYREKKEKRSNAQAGGKEKK